MVRITLVTIAVFLTGCASIRGIEVCKVKKSKVVCSDGKKNYTRDISYIAGFFAASEANLKKLANKLQHCEQESKK